MWRTWARTSPRPPSPPRTSIVRLLRVQHELLGELLLVSRDMEAQRARRGSISCRSTTRRGRDDQYARVATQHARAGRDLLVLFAFSQLSTKNSAAGSALWAVRHEWHRRGRQASRLAVHAKKPNSQCLISGDPKSPRDLPAVSPG